MAPHQGVLIILDGLGDRPVASLGGLTPLEAARTPHLDRLAAAGVCGFVHPLVPWVPAGTQTGSGLLMGLARADVPRLARGPVEAAGVGLALQDGDLALRCNFATLSPNGATFDILDRRAGRISEGAEALAEALDGLDLGTGVTTRLRAATEHRAVLLLSGPGLSDAVTDTDPGAGRQADGVQPCTPRRADDAPAAHTATLVNRFVRHSYDVLKDHPVNRRRVAAGLPPANGLITRGAGAVPALRNLVTHLGLRAAVVAGEQTMVGLGRLFGFDVIREPSFTAAPDTDLDAKVRATLRALDRHDLVFLHVKATDTLAHDRRAAEKKAFIERLDAALAPLLTPARVVGVTGDHCTDSTLGVHTGDPVPACLAAPHLRSDAVTRFGESACLGGGLGHLSATAFLCAVLDHMGCMHNFKTHEHAFFW